VTVVDIVGLGTLGGCCSSARGMNGSGQVVGASSSADGANHAFLWDRATGMRDLGTLGGAQSVAAAVNAAGQVVGTSLTPDGTSRAFLWESDRGMRELRLPPGYESASADDINDRGQIVGTASAFCSDGESAATALRTRAATRPTIPHAAMRAAGEEEVPLCLTRAIHWEPDGEPAELAGLGAEGLTLAGAINNAGQVTGIGVGPGAESGRALLWEPGAGPMELGTLGGDASLAVDINDAGQVVGFSERESNGAHAFVWGRGTGLTDLGTLPGHDVSFALAINDAGHVVGESSRIEQASHGFFLHPDAGMVDLGEGFAPVDLNDAGQVVGTLDDQALLVTLRVSENAAPVVSRPRAGVWPPGHPSGLDGVWLRVRLADANDARRWRWRIDWGDDVVHAPTVTRKGDIVFLRRQGYARPGTYTITASATDADGAMSERATTTVTVP
jgi:probable HAF family extracellular repeat protein